MKAHKNKWFAIFFSAFASSVLLYDLGIDGSDSTFLATLGLCIVCYVYSFYQIYYDNKHYPVAYPIFFALLAAGLIHFGLLFYKFLLPVKDQQLISLFSVWCGITFIYFSMKKKANNSSDFL